MLLFWNSDSLLPVAGSLLPIADFPRHTGHLTIDPFFTLCYIMLLRLFPSPFNQAFIRLHFMYKGLLVPGKPPLAPKWNWTPKSPWPLRQSLPV